MNEQKLYRVARIRSDLLKKNHKYEMVFWDKFDYKILSQNIMYYKKKGKYRSGTWNDVIIAADTETSKAHYAQDFDEFGNPEAQPNHVVAWTISIRAFHINIVTLYGTKPSEMMECLKAIKGALKGDELYVYFHNLAYDYVFLRLFLFDAFGTPKKQLATKPHYPIMIGFKNGIILKDSLILFNRKLAKVAEDFNVDHQKAVGSWDYDQIRDQGGTFSDDELHYIENDTLALVECLDAFCISLNKTIYSIPYTATGVPREEVRNRAKAHNGHEAFKRVALTYEQFLKFIKCYHGGYSHGNRFLISLILNDEIMRLFDFNSSYPFCLLAFRYPGKFAPLGKDVSPEYILRNSEKYGFVFRISFINIKLKDNYYPMPSLQSTKCEKSINMVTDNGRVISAGYCTLYISSPDLEVIDTMYEWESAKCTEVEFAKLSYLPRWFTDYVYECYEAKCKLKPIADQKPVDYALSKAKVNSLYGLCCQRSVRESFIEVTEPGLYQCNPEGDFDYYESGEYRVDYAQDLAKEYEKYLENPNTVLAYQIGTFCTAYAFRNLFKLGSCIKEYRDDNGRLLAPIRWVYSDTDSVYSDDWDYLKIYKYNEWCKEQLQKNGYGPVVVGDKEYWLGVAEHDEPGDSYEEFVVLGSKRYAGRCLKDHKLKITVAGVPKKKGALCLNDDIKNFQKDFIFDGKLTGKLSHFYIFSKQGIYIDDHGNEIGDSIDLQPCSYHLDAVNKWEYLETEDYNNLYFGEENFDIYDR